MPKMKTKSSAKKRFRFTASGKVKFSHARKRHMLRRRSQKMKRKARGMEIMNESDKVLIMKYMPYNR